jgi:AraC family transcriptional regulator
MIVSTGFVYLRPLNVAAVRAKGPYAQSSVAAWDDMFGWLKQTGLIRQIGTGFGLLLDDPRAVDPAKCRYEACVELVEEARRVLPETFSVRRLPGGAYARRRHVGGVAGLAHTISQMRHDWMPGQGVMIDSRRPVIEIYLDNPDTVPVEAQRIDVCMPVMAVENFGRTAA